MHRTRNVPLDAVAPSRSLSCSSVSPKQNNDIGNAWTMHQPCVPGGWGQVWTWASLGVKVSEFTSACKNCSRISDHVSPKMYTCFLDESLNSLLRDVAVYAHRMRFETRVFSLFHLQAQLQICEHFVGQECLVLISGPI